MEGCYVQNTKLLDMYVRLAKYTWVNICFVDQVWY